MEEVLVEVKIAKELVGIKLNPNELYTTDQIAVKLGVPEYAIRDRVRDGRLVGEKIGQFFFVTGANFIKLVSEGFSYSPRPTMRKKTDLTENIEHSKLKELKRSLKSEKP